MTNPNQEEAMNLNQLNQEEVRELIDSFIKLSKASARRGVVHNDILGILIRSIEDGVLGFILPGTMGGADKMLVPLMRSAINSNLDTNKELASLEKDLNLLREMV